MRPSHTHTAALLLLSALLYAHGRASAQAAPAQKSEQTPQVFCDPSQARALVREQLSEAKALADVSKRVSLLTSAADLLWPHDRSAARDIFTEACELAAKDFKEQKEQTPTPSGGVLMPKVDRRFVVMTAIARRDPAWARALAEGVADERLRAAEESKGATAAGRTSQAGGAEGVLDLAQSLLPVDRATALNIARGSFRFPASYALMLLLFKLAETDRAAADALYREALAAYADRSAADLAYLAVYPFALNREPASVPIAIYYTPPPNFSPDPRLRELFLSVLFRQIEAKFKTPESAPPPEPDGTPTEQAQLLTALVVLEPYIARTSPALLERAQWLKGTASAAAANSSRERAAYFARNAREYDDEGMFERSLEKAEGERDAGRRAFAVTRLVMAARTLEEFRRAEPFLDRVSDGGLREKVAGYFYFLWAQAAVREGQLDEATRVSGKVGELDYRALLSFEIAEAALKRLDDRARAGELLDAVADAGLKAKDTREKARALLGVAHLYARFDVPRAAQVLRSAVKVINTLRDPDFSSDSVGRELGDESFTVYAMHRLPGVRLENVFRELGARDFGAALSAAGELSDKYVRATATLALASKCLERAEARP